MSTNAADSRLSRCSAAREATRSSRTARARARARAPSRLNRRYTSYRVPMYVVSRPVIPHPSSILARWMARPAGLFFLAVAAEVNASLRWRCDGVARARGTRAAIALDDGCVAMLVWLGCLLRNCGTSWLQHGLGLQQLQVDAVDGGDVGLGIESKVASKRAVDVALSTWCPALPFGAHVAHAAHAAGGCTGQCVAADLDCDAAHATWSFKRHAGKAYERVACAYVKCARAQAKDRMEKGWASANFPSSQRDLRSPLCRPPISGNLRVLFSKSRQGAFLCISVPLA